MSQNNWIAPTSATLPDFIICGAMKSGTSTLHDILNFHPEVYIPSNEIHFFDIDDIFQHPDFNFFEHGKWMTQSMEHDREKLWKWYSSFFKDRKEKLIGEDSTNYLASHKAIGRIALQSQPVKLIIMLRNPVKRAYSQYYHMLRTGRAEYNFEDTLRYNPYSVLQRSMYKTQLEEVYRTFPKDRVQVVLFEDFLADKRKTVQKVGDFLGIDTSMITEDQLNTHSNQANLPKKVTLQTYRNRLLREFGNLTYVDYLPNTPKNPRKFIGSLERVWNKCHSMVNPHSHGKPKPMNPATEHFLSDYFKSELEGFDDLINQDAMSKWFKS